MEELVPTRAVWRGPGAAHKFVRSSVTLDDVPIRTDGGRLSFSDALEATGTDGIIVLHRGAVVHEAYFGHLSADLRHVMMSCNKSIVGLVAECLLHEGLLDEAALVPTVVPELAGSAWGDATIRDVLDMRVGLAYDEDYTDPNSDVWRFLRCTGMVPPAPGQEGLSIAEVLPTFAKRGEHGAGFSYEEPNIFVLGWIVRRVVGASLADIVSDRIYRHLGAEHDAFYMLDPAGADTTAAATLRDFARFGQLIADGGKVGDSLVVPAEVIDRIRQGGDRDAFASAGLATLPGWSYRSQWWIRHLEWGTATVARGAYGQMLYVDATQGIVIARFGSAEGAPSALLDPIVLPTIDAIVERLGSRS